MATRFEPIWRCDLCGSDGLLGHSHAFCANCGHAHDGEPVRFPTWDELVVPSDHRFHGAHTRCCGQGWSLQARHCGRCGLELVEIPRGLTALTV